MPYRRARSRGGTVCSMRSGSRGSSRASASCWEKPRRSSNWRIGNRPASEESRASEGVRVMGRGEKVKRAEEADCRLMRRPLGGGKMKRINILDPLRGRLFHLPVNNPRYVLVSQAPPVRLPDGTAYENTERCYSLLNLSAAAARHLELVDPLAFDDRRNPDPLLYADYSPGPDFDDNPQWILDDFADWELPSVQARFHLAFNLPEVTTTGYSYSLCDQAVHIELWCEKSTLNDV